MSHYFAPFEQFKIKEIFSLTLYNMRISFTNSSLVFVIVVSVLIGSFLFSAMANRAYIPGKIYAIWEGLYVAIRSVLANALGDLPDSPKVKKYARFVFSLFIFILSFNLLGLFPYSYAVTSDISITLTLAAIVFIACVSISIKKHGIYFYKIFVPPGTPWWIAPLVFILEFFAYLARPFSLSVRLAANILAGHVILEVIAFFCVIMGVFFIVPYIALIVLSGFEFMVAALQAYIFTILTSIYLAEADHH